MPALHAPLLTALALATAPAPSDDERIILAHEAFVITFDASTVVIDGPRRQARMHLYLPAPEKDGFTSFVALERIDCAVGTYRYTDATGRKDSGATEAMTPDTPGPQPIGKETPIAVLRDHLCALTDLRRGSFGVRLEVPGPEAARAVFALLKVGLDAKPAAALASQGYADRGSLRYNLDEQKVAPADRARVIAALAALVAEAKPPPPIVPLAAAVASGRAGQYLHSEMELGAGLWLKLDGTFEYGLTVGSLDETARGRWTASGDRITLLPDVAPVRRSAVDVCRWQVTADGHTLTIVRDGRAMVFDRRRPE